MKKLSIIIIAILSITMISCNKDNSNAELILGSWDLYKVVDGTDVATYTPGTLLFTFSDVAENTGKYKYENNLSTNTEIETGEFSISEKGTAITLTEKAGESNSFQLELTTVELVLIDNDRELHFNIK